MKTEMVFLQVLLGELISFAIFMSLPLMHTQRTASGGSEGKDFQETTRRAANGYRLILTGLFIASTAAIYLVLIRWQTQAGAALISIGFNVAALFCYINYARQVGPFAVPSPITRYAVSLRVRRLVDYTHTWLEALILILTIGPLVLLMSAYPGMPDQIPVHFNITGEPDGWARKSLGSAFFAPALSVYLQAVFLLIKYDMVHAKMILPEESTEEVLRYKEQFLKTNAQLFDLVRVSCALLLAMTALLPVNKSLGEVASNMLALASTLIWIGPALLVGGLSYFIWRLLRIKRDLEVLSPGSNAPCSVDDQYWRQGGLVYKNPEDPAVMIEKLVGLGYTYNMASRGVYWRLAILVGVPLFVVWAFSFLR
jgi:uncharacterized membrane protein